MASTVSSIFDRRYQRCKEINQPVFDRVEINKNLYKGIMNVDADYEWDYTLVDNQVFPLVRNYLSRSNPTMSAMRLDIRRSADIEKRQSNQDFMNWEVGEIMLTSTFYRMFFSAYVAPRGYIKTGWKYMPAIQIEEKDENGNVTRFKVMRDITNRADAKFVPFNHILVPDRNIVEFQEQPYYIELIQQRVGDMLNENESLKQKGENPYWDEAFLKKLKDSGVTGKLLDYEMARAEDEDSKEDLAFKSAVVPLMCMHTLDGDEFYKPLPSTGYEETINTDTHNRYWHGHYPIIDFGAFLEDDEYNNIALVDVVGDYQIANTEILNQSLTNIRQINNDMWIVGSAGAQTPDWQFRKRPDGVIRVMGDASQVQQVRTQDNTRSAMVMSQELTTKNERTGGISSLYSSGAPSQQINQTARGAQIIEGNIDTNMKMIIDLFGERVLKPLGEHFLELNAQYVTEEQFFSVTGKKGVKQLMSISPEEVSANFEITVNPDKIQKQSPASVQASLQNTIKVLQDVSVRSGGAIDIDLTPVVEALIDSIPEMEGIENIITTVDEKSRLDISSLERGQMPEIKIRDAHEELVVAVNVHYTDNEASYPEEIRQLFEDYVKKHLAYIQSKTQMIAMEQQSAMMAQAAAGTLGGAGAPPAGGGAAITPLNPNTSDTEGLPGNEGTPYNLKNIVATGGQ